MKKLILILLLIFIVGCIPEDAIWISKKPIQCLGNEWEQDYLESYNVRYENYPISKENKIIKEFYLKNSVKIYKIEKEDMGMIVCTACNCPRGDVLKLLISGKDLDRMKSFGYESS